MNVRFDVTDDEVVLAERQDGVLTLTLNRPDRMNAWTRAMESRYFDLLDEADADPVVRAIVVTGAGRGFCPGMDTSSLLKATTTGPSTSDRRPMTHALTVRKPMIAAVNGGCAGIGLVQALICDVRFAAAGVKLATSFARRGLPAEFSTSWLLPRFVGHGHAMDLLVSGRPVMAEEAQSMGLVNRVVPGPELLDVAHDYARDLADHCSPVAMAAIKAQVLSDWERTQSDALAHSLDVAAEKGRRPDFSEGVNSYAEKRPPKFRALPPKGTPLDGWT
jgi:enoyl-CoA hydratase/carnithine racemase